MKRTIRLLFPLLWGISCWAQVPVAPIVQPHATFVDAAGLPCAGCTLGTFAAGTSTPLATYIDSTGTSQNTNPIVLDASGGPANPSGSTGGIWLSSNSYKLVLKDALGNTIWTVDNVKGGGGLGGVCGPSGAIQIANSGVNGLTCDSSILINPTNHTINVGTLPANFVTIGALGTPTTWTFDTTTPATALASLGAGAIGPGTIGQIAFYPATGNNIQGATSLPDGITVITRSPNDNSANPANTAYVAHPGGIDPTTLQLGTGPVLSGDQGNGALIQHSTGATTSGNCANFDVFGNTTDAGFPCTTPNSTSFADVTGSRSFGSTFQNTSGHNMYVSGYATTHGGDTIQLTCAVGATSPSTTEWSAVYGATVSGGTAGFSCFVPPSYFYSVTAGMSGFLGLGSWVEVIF